MNILILTQPLRSNYGGILQAYALQKLLTDKGYRVTTDNPAKVFHRTDKSIIHQWYRFIRKYLTHKPQIVVSPPAHFKRINAKIDSFIRKYIQTVDFRAIGLPIGRYDAIIVGSDQVWRPTYNHDQEYYFLHFADNIPIKKIAYAASFGISRMSEYGKDLLERCARLAKQFDAVSVREESGLHLCREYLGIDARLVLDPTLLIEKETYEALIPESNKTAKPYVLSYILDSSADKQTILERVGEKLDLPVVRFMQEGPRPKSRNNGCYPPVEEWLKSFRDAQWIVTDSFHGMVFAIIFQKPFAVTVNHARGQSRFTSLLQLLKLENRIVTSPDEALQLIDNRIDYVSVHKIRTEWKQRSIDFLLSHLR